MARQSVTEYLDLFYRCGSDIATLHRRGYRIVRWSYREIAETACQFARELEARKIERGDAVFIWGENCGEWIVAFWGCLLRGVVVVPMDHSASPDFALRVLRQVDAKLIVCSAEKSGLDPAVPVLPFEALREAVSRHDRSPYPATIGRADRAEIIFTSGTTAEPKGVVITHGNLLANLEPLEAGINEYIKYERLVHPLRFLNLLPLSHVFGQLMAVFVPPLLSGTVIFQDSLNPSEVIRTIKRQRVSILVTVPRLLESLKDKIERDAAAEGKHVPFQNDLQLAATESYFRRWWRFRRIHNQFGWKFWAFVSGGARLGEDVETFWSRLAFFVVQGYGLTETTSLISLNHPFKLSKGSIGKALPGREIKLDASGEILVRGESVASAYLQNRELRPAEGEGGWFRTGDLGEMDERGNLYFKGRKKNVIVTAEGMNVYPEDLEAALRRQPEVRDAVVVAVEKNGREEPCAVLLLRSDSGGAAKALAESVVHRANQSLAAHQQMRCWFEWPGEDFPRTSTQKPRLSAIAKAVQEQLSGEQRSASSSGGVVQGELPDLIRRITGRKLSEISANAGLETGLNLSSIERVELLSAMEDRYQIDLDETNFAAAATAGDIERLLHQAAPQRSDFPYPSWPQLPFVNLVRVLIYYLLTWPATALLGWPKVTGRENLRGLRGPVLIVSNHITEIDIGFILFALPPRFRHRMATAMGGERLWAMWQPPAELSWPSRQLAKFKYFLLVALMNVFPLPQQSGFRESFQFAGESLDRGYSVLVFPEGMITKDGTLSPFRNGIGILASKLNASVIPIRIDGLYQVKQSRRKIAFPGEVAVTIGAPVRFEPQTDPAEITRELERCVQAL